VLPVSENQKPVEQEPKNEKKALELKDVPQELSKQAMKDIQAGIGRAAVRDKRRLS
jgi:hypothetical protein